MNQLWIEQRRGFALEATHAVDAVLVTAGGETLARIGEPRVTTFRSAAKPFQLAACLPLLSEAQAGALQSVDLALGSASHHGEPMHLAGLAELHARLGVTTEQLHCGACLPLHEPSAHELLRRGEQPSALHNNCAGKHSFMAAVCAAQNYAPDYRPPDHPLQVQIRALLDTLTEGAIVGAVVDGCGAPCFVLPLDAMALAWARLGAAVAKQDGPLAQIGAAWLAHPQMMSGTLAFDGWLCGIGKVLAKVGAQGLLCAAVPDQGLGVAIKVRSGSDAARPAAAMAVLRSWFGDLVSESLPATFAKIRNVVGDVVGEIIPRSPEQAPPVH